MTIVSLVAQLKSLAGSEAVVSDLLADYAPQVRAEEGNMVFLPNVMASDPGSFVVYEEYRDEESFKKHLATTHNADFNRAVAPHIEGGAAALTILTRIGEGA